MGSGGPAGERAGSLLRGYRRTAGLSQRQLAGAAGVSVGVVRDLEQGRTGRLAARSVAALVAVLGLDADRAEEFASAARGGPRPAAIGGPGRVRLAVLGPLAAWRGDATVELGPPSLRAVLGLLALSPGELVRRESLIDAWWGEDLPRSAASQVQARVTRLRRILDPGRPAGDAGGLLASAGTGYRLRLTGGQLDLLVFRDLASRADAAARAGQPAAACGLFESALDLWRGDPVADIDALRQHPAVTGLSRQRRAVMVSYAELACELGWYDRVLPLAWQLAEHEPLHETAHAVLMIALAGTGRQAAALEVFEDLRHRLDEQLGVCPGRELARAHLRVLRAELPAPCPGPGAAALRGRPGAEAVRGQAVPRQLPPASQHFAGRAAELAALSRLLDQPECAAAMVISAVGGAAGVGKTALAVHWAHRVAARFPDGQLYVNLRGFGPSGRPASPGQALRGFLDALAVPAERVPRDLDAQVGLYRSLLAGKRMLIVLDNARDAGQVRPLLPGAPGCLVLVTSRNQLTSLAAADGAQLLDLDVLTPGEARQLLAARLGAGRVAAEPAPVTEILDLCGRLPLALAITAARAAARPAFPLIALAAELRQGPLDALAAGGDPTADARAVLSWSYHALTRQAARLFRLLGLHPGPDISVPAAASLAGRPLNQARRRLAELADAHLINEHLPGRYALHDLLRAYAAELAGQTDSAAERRAAAERILDHYLHAAHAAGILLDPSQDLITVTPPGPGVIVDTPAGQDQALAWLTAEHAVLLAAIDFAADHRLDTHTWQLAWSIWTYLDRRGRWDELEATQRTALDAGRRLADVTAQAHAHGRLARSQVQRGDLDAAQAHLTGALSLYQQIGDQLGQGGAHSNLAIVCVRRGRHAEALGHARLAHRHYRAAGNRRGQASALSNLAWCQAELGRYQQALQACEHALALYQDIDDQHGQGGAWDTLGYARHGLGDHQLAIACYQRALTLYRQGIGDRYYEADTLTHLGDAHYAAGNTDAARGAFRQALAILDELDHPDAGPVRARLQGLNC